MAAEARGTSGRVVTAVAGGALSLALLGWALRDVDFADIWRQVQRAEPLPVLVAVVLACLVLVLRLARWRVLLRAEGGGALPAAPLWHAIAIGFAGNNVLPFRAGELMRCVIGSRGTGMPFPAVLASLALERLFDGLTVIGLLAVALVASGLPADTRIAGVEVGRIALASGGIVIAGLLAALGVVLFPAAAERVVRAVVPSPALAEKVVGLIAAVRHGLAVFRSPAQVARVAGWSLAVWLVNAASFWACFPAFGIKVGFAGALLLQGVLAIGIAIPSTPGFIGPFEAAIKAVLLLYGVPGDTGVSYALTYHVTTFVPVVLLGLWSLSRVPFTLGELRAAGDTPA